MGQTLDMLLSIDPEKIKARPTKKVKMERLSKLAGAPVYFTIKALSLDEAAHAREQALKIRDGEEYYDQQEVNIFMVLEGVVDPDLRDARLREHFGEPTPKELLKNGKFLLAGEILDLSEEIGKLSGYNSVAEADIEEIKN